jgi:hypothetical protein
MPLLTSSLVDSQPFLYTLRQNVELILNVTSSSTIFTIIVRSSHLSSQTSTVLAETDNECMKAP